MCVQGPVHLRTGCPHAVTYNTRPGCSPHHCRCRTLPSCACASLLLLLLLLLLLHCPSLLWPCQLRGPGCCAATVRCAWRGWEQLSSQVMGQPAVLGALRLRGQQAPVMPSHPARWQAHTFVHAMSCLQECCSARTAPPRMGGCGAACAQTNLFWLLGGPSSSSCNSHTGGTELRRAAHKFCAPWCEAPGLRHTVHGLPEEPGYPSQHEPHEHNHVPSPYCKPFIAPSACLTSAPATCCFEKVSYVLQQIKLVVCVQKAGACTDAVSH